MKYFFAIIFTWLASTTIAQETSEYLDLPPQQQLQNMMQTLLPFASENLEAFGEFYPYGAALTQTGEVKSVVGHQGDEFPEQQQVADNIINKFKQGIIDSGYIATAMVTDVTIQSPGKSVPVKAVAVHLEHQEGLSLLVYLPYLKTQQGLQWGKMIVNQGHNLVFNKVQTEK